MDCHNREQLCPNIQESWQYVSRGGDCVDVCSNETAGADIRYKSVRKLRASSVAIITISVCKRLEEMTGNFNSEVQKRKSLFEKERH